MSGADHRRPPGLWLAGLVVAGVAMGTFANSLLGGFPLDDEFIIVRNPMIRTLSHLPRLFTTDYWAGPLGPGTDALYRPLALATYALNFAAGGLTPWGYHAANVILHAAVSVTVWTLGRRFGLGAPGALVAGLVFAAHPIHTEAVASVVGRAELLMALGVLLAWLWYPGRSEARSPEDGRLVASCMAFAAGLLAKEQAVVLPVLLLVYDAVRARVAHEPEATPRPAWRSWWRYGPYVAILGGYALLRSMALGGPGLSAAHGIPTAENPLGSLAGSVRALTLMAVAGKYLWLVVWPAHLSADYSFDAIPAVTAPLDPGVLAAVIGWGLVLGLGIGGWIRRSPILVLGAALTLLAFLPASNVLVPIGTIMGERLFYLPSAGLCLLLGAGGDRLWGWLGARGGTPLRRASVAGLALVVLALGARSAWRNRDWRDTRSVWESAVAVVPGSAKAQVQHARSLLQRAARLDEVRGHLQVAVDIHRRMLGLESGTRTPPAPAPERSAMPALAGEIEIPGTVLASGRPPTAMLLETIAQLYFLQAERSTPPSRAPGYASIEPLFRRALDIRAGFYGPDHPEVATSLNNLASFYAFQRRYDEAQTLFERALAIRERALGPDHPDVAASCNSLGLLAFHRERYGEAETLYRRAIAILERSLGPDRIELAPRLENYAALLIKTGRRAEADRLLERARALRAAAAPGA